MCELTLLPPEKQARWICCKCHFGVLSMKLDLGCPNCGHWRCDQGSTGIYFPPISKCESSLAEMATPVEASSSPDAPIERSLELEMVVARTETLQPNALDQIIMNMPHLVNLSEMFGSGSDNKDLTGPASPSSETVDEDHEQRDEQPSCGFGFRSNVLGMGRSSKTALGASSPGILGVLGRRRRKETSEDDSPTSRVYTPTESEASSSTLDHSVREAATPGVMSDLEGSDFDKTEKISPSDDTTSFIGTPGEDLFELPWFHRNVRRVLRGLLQQQHGFRTATHDQAQPETSDQQGLGAHQQQGSGGGKRRREQADSDDEADQGDTSAGRSKRARRPKGMAPSRPFSCPFCKKDLQRYQACAKFGLTRVPHVKQHLHRKHGDEIDDLVKNRLKQRSARGTEEEQWYGIFDLLFPGHLPRPTSPYNDFTVSEQAPQTSPYGVPIDEALYVPGVFLTRDSIEALHQALVRDPVFADVRAEDIRRALDRGLSRAYVDQISRPVASLQTETQQNCQRETAESGQSSSARVSGQEQDLSATDPSDECEFENDHPRPTELNPTPLPEEPWNADQEDTRQRDYPHGVNSSTNEPTHDQQPSLGGQLEPSDGLGLDFSLTEDQLPPVSEWDHLFDLDSLLGASMEDSWQAIDKVQDHAY